jgi:class 3 adenylate cyclase
VNGLLAKLNAYEPEITAAVGLITLVAALYGFVRLVVIPPLAARRSAPQEGPSVSGFGLSSIWRSLVGRGVDAHAELTEQVAVRTLNASVVLIIVATLVWLAVTLISGGLLILSIINFFAFGFSIIAYNLQAASKTGVARWLFLATVNVYWGINIVVMGTNAGLEYFLGFLLLLPLLLFGRERSLQLGAAVLLVLICALLALVLERAVSFELPPQYREVIPNYYYVNILVLSVLIFLVLYAFNGAADASFRQIEDQTRKSEELIHRILPDYIADKYAEHEATIADWHSEASVLFATVCGFEHLYAQVSSVQLLEILRQVFGEFDELVEAAGIEKVNTLGANYVAATGLVPDQKARHSELARVALEMREVVARLSRVTAHPFTLRVGISTGDVVSGVIGEARPNFDIWGSTVELAIMMRSDADEDTIVVNQAAHWRLKDSFELVPLGGELARYRLQAKRPGP